jgi:hypothetical protein
MRIQENLREKSVFNLIYLESIIRRKTKKKAIRPKTILSVYVKETQINSITQIIK